MNFKSQILGAWCGLVCPLFMFAGLWPMAHFFPPPLPSASADEIVKLYVGNLTGIRMGMIMFFIAGALYGAFSATISAQMRLMEYRTAPVLSYMQLAAGIASVWLFFVPALVFSVAAYRPERSPEITQVLNDIGWFTFVMPFTLGFLQNIALGFAILADKSARPTMPRWVGYFNLWIAVLFVPACLLTFFKSGPFAWNGLLAFWLPAIAFGVWFNVIGFMLIKAAKNQKSAALNSPLHEGYDRVATE